MSINKQMKIKPKTISCFSGACCLVTGEFFTRADADKRGDTGEDGGLGSWIHSCQQPKSLRHVCWLSSLATKWQERELSRRDCRRVEGGMHYAVSIAFFPHIFYTFRS